MSHRPAQLGSKPAAYRCPFVRQSSRRAGGWRQFEKLQASRARRRAERVNPEDAPTRNHYCGWAW